MKCFLNKLNGKRKDVNMNKKVVKKSIFSYVLLALVIFGVIYFFTVLNKKVNDLSYSQLIKSMDKNKITELKITPNNSAGVYELTGKMKGYKENESFKSSAPLADETIKELYEGRNDYGFEVKAAADPSSSIFLSFILNVLPLFLIVGIGFYFITRQMGAANKSMDFGKSRARLTSDKDKVTFKEVAGLEEEKEEVAELIDFLKQPKKFQSMGARIPKGVLLVGPPGTGKTLLAKAVAGEANVPFYYISGSDFVELFVGVGASRVRDMFKQAKHNAPCLIFIDEIDAVGRQRGAGLGGGHDERE